MSSAEAEIFKNQGNAALNRGDFPDAIKAYTEAIRLDPTNHIYYSNRAAAYTSCSLIDQAIDDAKKTIELEPKWAKGYSRLGAAYARQGDVENAHKAYEDGLSHCPGDATLKQGIAHLEGMMNQQRQQIFGQMFHNLRERLSKDPRTSALMNQPDFSAMVDDLAANPGNFGRHQSNPNFNTLLQVALSSVIPPGAGGAGPSPSPAHAAPTPVPSAAPSSSSSSSSSSSAAPADKMEVEKEPEPEEVDPEEKERLEKKKQAVAAKEEGNELYKAHKFDEAIAAYNRAIQLDPTEMSFLTNRAAVHFQTGNYDECIQSCEEAIIVGREHRASFGLIAKALVRIGNAHYKLGNLDAALDAFRKSQTEERSRETAKLINKVEQEKARRDEQAYLNPELSLAAKERGNALFKEGKYPLAVTEYTEAIKRNPTDPVLYSNRAITYQKLWEFPKALEDCDKALELDPKFARAYARKGQTLTIQQEYSKALDVFRAGLVIEPENTELKAGLQRVVQLINQQHATGQVDPERAKRAMADPEIQAILKDPEVSSVLQRAQTDSQALQRAMTNERIRHKIEKLVAAGIL